jgi:Icc-related predicted phosphoesterase
MGGQVRLLILSDIHCEFHPDRGDAFFRSYEGFDDYDVAVIAGDLCDFASMRTALTYASRSLKRVVYVLGNHCCYGAYIAQAARQARWLAEELGNVDFLDASFVTIDGVRFVGATLWFPEEYDNALYERHMTDFRVIRDFRRDVYKQARCESAWLNVAVEPGCVVVTHHLPSRRSVAPRWKSSELNRFFVHDHEQLIQEEQPRLWIHGHTHDSIRYSIGKTQVIANPYGYAGHEVNPGFDGRMVVDI